MMAKGPLGFTDSALYTEMLRTIPVSKILNRLFNSWDHEAAVGARNEILLHYAETTDISWGTNAHTLVHWEYFMDDLIDCMIELDYPHPKLDDVFPPEIFNPGGTKYKSKIFIDMEN